MTFFLFCRHANCVRQLNVGVVYDDEDASVLADHMLAVVGTQCSSLQSLTMYAPGVGLASPGLAALTALTQLSSLEVCTNLL